MSPETSHVFGLYFAVHISQDVCKVYVMRGKVKLKL